MLWVGEGESASILAMSHEVGLARCPFIYGGVYPHFAHQLNLFSLGCSYHWYDTAKICLILERFDGVVFVGDETLQSIYAGFNILLRQDLGLGAMKQWE